MQDTGHTDPMPMLAFLPWLRLREPIRVGRFLAFSHGVGDTMPDGVEAAVEVATIGKVLSQYRTTPHLPLRVMTVVQYDGRPVGSELGEADRAAIFRFGQQLAVSGLADRKFVGGFLDEYTASGHYQVIIQAFQEPYHGSVSLTHRRKGGHMNVTYGQTDVYFVVPDHLVQQAEAPINLPLLAALQQLDAVPEVLREHVDASVTQYLLANSDSPDVSLEAESIATYAALERVSNSTQRLDDIQAKLPAILAIVEGSPWTSRLRDELESCVEDGQPTLHSWLQHIYMLRGNVAHGKPAHWAPKEWSQQEHLVAGALVYPLVLKCLLAQQGLYALTVEDVAWVLGLEGFLGNRPFYEVPPPAEGDAMSAASDAKPDQSPRPPDRARWQLQFEHINQALLGLSLSASVQASMDEIEARGNLSG